MQAPDVESMAWRLSRPAEELELSFVAWSRGDVSEGVVSDKYVTLGNEFNTTKAKLKAAKIDISQLVDVPGRLRTILEKALALPCSPSVAETFNPQIQAVASQLFSQLKAIQRQLEHKQSRNRLHVQQQLQLQQQQLQQQQQPQIQVSQAQAPQVPSSSGKASLNPRVRPQPYSPVPGIPPPPVPPADDALSQLQRHGALERQASKRYSTRQLSRIVNGASVEQLPTTGVHRRFSTPDFIDSSVVKERVPEPPEPSVQRRSPARNRVPTPRHSRKTSAGSVTRVPVPSSPLPSPHSSPRTSAAGSANGGATAAPPDEMSVFLRIGSRIRKATLSRPPSIAAIRLQFVEVCEYIHTSDGVFPEITLQDAKTNIEYELTEATVKDVTDGSLLALMVKTAEESSIASELKELKEAVSSLVARGNVPSTPGPPPVPRGKFASPVLTGDGRFKIEKPAPDSPNLSSGSGSSNGDNTAAIAEIRQLTSGTVAALRKEIAYLRSEAQQLSSSSTHTVSSRSAMTDIMSQVDDNTRQLLAELEDLSDLIDAQRVSVGLHGVQLPAHELDKVRSKLDQWMADFERQTALINSEKPLWKKTWESELQNIIKEQEWLKDLALTVDDLQSDLNQSRQTFELVCEANKLPRRVTGSRRGVLVAPPIAPGEEKNVADAVLHEIRALDLNSEKRTEAMQRAERMHRIRAAMRSEEFEYELGSFVKESKLKPNGGIEEVEKKILERERETRRLAEESEAKARELEREILEEKKRERKRQREERAKAARDATSQADDSQSADPSAAHAGPTGAQSPAEVGSTDRSPAESTSKNVAPTSTPFQPPPAASPRADSKAGPTPVVDTRPAAESRSADSKPVVESRPAVEARSAMSSRSMGSRSRTAGARAAHTEPQADQRDVASSREPYGQEHPDGETSRSGNHEPKHADNDGQPGQQASNVQPMHEHYQDNQSRDPSSRDPSRDPSSRSDLSNESMHSAFSHDDTVIVHRSTPVPQMVLPTDSDDEFLDMGSS